METWTLDIFSFVLGVFATCVAWLGVYLDRRIYKNRLRRFRDER